MLKDLEDQINACIRCGACDEKCSLYLASGDPEVSPSRKIEIANKLLKKEDVSLNDLLKAAYACTLCGICERACSKGIEIRDIVRAMRAEIVRDRKAPAKIVQLCENIIKRGSMTGGGDEFWSSWMPDDLSLPDKAENIYLVGCMIPFKIPSLGRSTLEMLLKAGVNLTILREEERCCGLLLWEHGFIEEFRKIAEENVKKIKLRKAKRVIVSCAACYYAYNEIYPKVIGERMEVKHVLEVLDELIKAGKLKPRKPIQDRVVYFDACHFTRYTGKYDLPRRLIESIPKIELVELPRNKELGYCCGISSGVKLVFKDLADSAGKMVIDEARKLGARKIITSCPLCMYQFASTIKKYNIKELEAIDLPLLLHRSTVEHL